MVAGRKSAFKEKIKPNLKKIKKWLEQGYLDLEICKNLNISRSTYYKYAAENSELKYLIKQSKEAVDREVEQALHRRATGYEYEEQVNESSFSPKHGESTTTRTVKKKMAPDPTSMIFWLKNRQPGKWRDKQEVDMNIIPKVSIGLPNGKQITLGVEEDKKLLSESDDE
jgi:hypothetical protein